MKTKRQGHYCKGCGDFLPNEKFSGKGRRKHLCKQCNKESIMINSVATSIYDKNYHRLSRAVKNCIIVYVGSEIFFLFEYQCSRYVIGDELNSKIFVYQGDKEQKFRVSEKLHRNEVVLDVLYKKILRHTE